MPSILEGVFSSSEDELNKMLISLVGMPKEQIEAELSAIKTRVEEVAQTIPTKGNKGDKGDKGDKGIQGPKGEPGRDGRDGFIGKDGKQGIDGKDGKDGKDGVSIVDVNVAFDNHLVVTLSDGTEIDAGVIGGLNENLQNVVANYVGNSANGTLIYKGLWNASTNTPTLTTSNVDAGSYYVVSVAGSTNLSGITDWQVNDWAIFNGTEWQKIDNSDLFNPSAVAITGGAINGTTIGSTTASTGRFTSVTTPSVTASSTDLTLSAISTGAVKFSTAGGLQMQVSDIASPTAYFSAKGGVSGGNAQFGLAGTGNTDLIQYTLGTGSFRFLTNGVGTEQVRFAHTASAVNYVQVTGGATGTPGNVFISAQGSDSNIRTEIRSKGTGEIVFGNSNGNWACTIVPTAFAVNRFNMASAATNQVPVFSVIGSDTNVPIALRTQGTGAIDLAAGSSGVNISNGGTVTAITRTNAGSSYTSKPSVAITAPTTAGGVTALASVNQMYVSGATIAGGGTGYTVNDVLTIVGGTQTGVATLTVSTVSAGVITAVTISSAGAYSVLPTSPVSVTGGTGTGATFNLTWSIISFTITNAGSGYIEQPTVSFSGGGGSGASAYATVGSTPIVKSLTTALDFYGSNGKNFSITDHPASGGGTAVNFVRAFGSQAGYTVGVMAQGTDANTPMLISSRGTGTIGFWTNSVSQQQFVVSHTASAVNYVQVTGAATSSSPRISTQGSDSLVSFGVSSKGGGDIFFQTNGSSNTGFLIKGSTTAVNYLQVAGNATTVAPVLSAQGTDTNIDLALTPKGTGRVQFGTYTANMALTVQGYIEILDSGGTIRKLAVIA